METIYVHQARWEGPAIQAGWEVHNAPRPLPGMETWTGQFIAGSLYAASPEAEVPHDELARMDASRIVLVNDDQALKLLEAALADNGYSTQDYRDAEVPLEAAYGNHGLGWAAPPEA